MAKIYEDQSSCDGLGNMFIRVALMSCRVKTFAKWEWRNIFIFALQKKYLICGFLNAGCPEIGAS